MRTNVYVDGFNLYYGSLRGTPYRWLDLRRLCELSLPRNTVAQIRYFTARVSARPGNPSKPDRQHASLRALETLPNISIHYGHYLESTVWMPLVNPPPGAPTSVQVFKTEEKGSDVNLATYMLLDGFRGACDAQDVISNDSDLCEPIRVVRRELGIPVVILHPCRPRGNPASHSAR